MVILPAAFTCFVATDAKQTRTLVTSLFFSSVSVAIASARPPLDKTLPAAFIAFIALDAIAMSKLAGQEPVAQCCPC